MENKVITETDSNTEVKPEHESDKVKEKGVLSVDIVIPSGRHDGKGQKMTVRYVNGSRNPI